MSLHRRARRLRIAGPQAFDDGLVLIVQRRATHLPGPFQHLHAQARLVAQIPGALDNVYDGAVTRGLGDGDVKLAVGQLALLLGRLLVVHLHDQGFQIDQLLIGDQGGGQRGHLALEQAACLGVVEGADVEILWRRRRYGSAALADIDSRALPGLEQAAHLQRNHRPADRGAADAELLGQVALGSQALAWLILAFGNGPFDRSGHLLIAAQGIGCRYRHGASRLLPHGRRPAEMVRLTTTRRDH